LHEGGRAERPTWLLPASRCAQAQAATVVIAFVGHLRISFVAGGAVVTVQVSTAGLFLHSSIRPAIVRPPLLLRKKRGGRKRTFFGLAGNFLFQ